MRSYIRLLRPAEWVKNTFVFAGIIFGRKTGDPEAIVLALAAFVAFSFTSSAGYIVNDFLDRERDRMHPVKKNRPIASGAILPVNGLLVGLLLLVLAAGICRQLDLPGRFALTLAGYLVLTLTYSFVFKHRMILDVITIAVLFVLRALGGTYAVDVDTSHWLLVCTFMLCLFLGFGKRRCEVAMLTSDDEKKGHRPTLVRYTPELLAHLLATSAGVAIVTFLLYTLDRDPDNPFGESKQNLVFTLPLVVYAIYRYAMLIELGKASGPTDLIVKDPPIVGAVVLWALAAAGLLYGVPFIGSG